MLKKMKYLLDNFDKIKEIIENSSKIEQKTTKKRVSIAGVPDEQKKYIQEHYKIEER